MEIVKIRDQGRQRRLIELQRAQRHRQLKSLSLVVHVGGKLDVTVALRDRIGIEPCPRVGDEIFERAARSAKVFGRRVQHARADKVMHQVRMQNAVGGQRAGIFREDHALNSRLVGDGDRVQPGGAAKGDHGELAGIDALLEQRQADRGAEIGIDHGQQSFRRGLGRKAERVGDLGIDHRACRFTVEAHPAAEELFAVDPAQRDIRIGHRRPGAAPPIAGGARIEPALSGPTVAACPAAPWRANHRRRRWHGFRPWEYGPACGPPRPA